MKSESPPPIDPEAILQKVMESGRNVKFGAGVSGKTSRMIYAVLGVWAIIVTRLSSDLVVDGVLIGAGLITTLLAVWWMHSTQNFAERNPAQAVLDGAQFIEYKRFEAQTKGQISDGPSPLLEDPIAPPRPAIPDREHPDG